MQDEGQQRRRTDARRPPRTPARRDLRWLPAAIVIWTASFLAVPVGVLVHQAVQEEPAPTRAPGVENAAETRDEVTDAPPPSAPVLDAVVPPGRTTGAEVTDAPVPVVQTAPPTTEDAPTTTGATPSSSAVETPAPEGATEAQETGPTSEPSASESGESTTPTTASASSPSCAAECPED